MGKESPFGDRAAGFGLSLERVQGSKMRPEEQARARIQSASRVGTLRPSSSFILLFLKKYLFIYLVALGLSRSLWAPQLRLKGSLVATHQLLNCGMRILSCGMRVGSSSLTRDRTWAPCIGSAES